MAKPADKKPAEKLLTSISKPGLILPSQTESNFFINQAANGPITIAPRGRTCPAAGVTATNPAKIFGMFPRKGTIGIGSDADIILLDPNERHTLSAKSHHMNVDYSGYEGMQLTGKVKTTILRGQVAVHNGEVRIKKGYGRFVKRNKVSGML